MSIYMIISVAHRNVRSKQLLKLALILKLNKHALLTPERFGSLILTMLYLPKNCFGFTRFFS